MMQVLRNKAKQRFQTMVQRSQKFEIKEPNFSDVLLEDRMEG